MEVYAARQPIFDRNMNTYGYELLYRRSSNNYYEGNDDQQATAELINNAFLVIQLNDLTGGTKAFINFSEELLVNEIPLLLPKDSIVVEILERVKPTADVIRACRNLKNNGYMLALDDFVFDETYEPLLGIADLIKVEYPAVKPDKQRQMISSYKSKYPLRFLAEKIETREQFQTALDAGYDLFQGYFFSKPVIVKGKEIGGLHASILQIVNELSKDEPNYQPIAEIIERDLGLSYKLLKIANSVAYGSRKQIYSIKQALVRFGIEEIKKWMYLLLLQEKQNADNQELVKTSLIRGKLMELLAIELGMKQKHFEFFLTGMFASIDVLLRRPMAQIVQELPFTGEVRDALLGQDNVFRQVLDAALDLEAADWERLDNRPLMKALHKETVMKLYIQSLKWVMEMHH
ncbi:EAL and HDOD domain-containing protein [Paenibacillus thalictri]|uniref:HDOD domain-containing protein n=1 Tax=Paenibacillus thalictri TaxID=2527873 RepID=A0A4Q9DUF0_9BACL|nr:HDOD domain-containing protein [Paenibacillus thalictri]TBL79510.1 HDOD domain-containing protein [Paenibacillus thalictri]